LPEEMRVFGTPNLVRWWREFDPECSFLHHHYRAALAPGSLSPSRAWSCGYLKRPGREGGCLLPNVYPARTS
jgi:hypothetical protein